jgi:DNA polymerase-3 subunit gamma/tau
VSTPAPATTGWATVTIPGSAPAATKPAATKSAATKPAATKSAATKQATAPAAAPPAAAPAAPPYDDAPPFDEEPPPFDDDVPPEYEAVPIRQASPAGPERQAPSANAGDSDRASAPASKRPAKAAPTFGEKQRYGEAVVREILGATFIEEQAHDSTPRTRGD